MGFDGLVLNIVGPALFGTGGGDGIQGVGQRGGPAGRLRGRGGGRIAKCFANAIGRIGQLAGYVYTDLGHTGHVAEEEHHTPVVSGCVAGEVVEDEVTVRDEDVAATGIDSLAGDIRRHHLVVGPVPLYPVLVQLAQAPLLVPAVQERLI